MKSQFSIPKPCHENWNAMTPDEQGRFCSQCSKSVTDFTQMSDDEVIIYLRLNSDNKVCGRFRKDQMEKAPIHIPRKVLYSQKKFINIFLLALLITMGSMLFSCGNNNPDLIGEPANVDTDTVSLPPPTSPKDEETHTLGMVAYPEDSVSTNPRFNAPEDSNNQIPKSAKN